MECIVQNSMETRGNGWNKLETTVSYRARARLTPTLTHVIMYELVTSGAEDGTMSVIPVLSFGAELGILCLPTVGWFIGCTGCYYAHFTTCYCGCGTSLHC